MGTLSAIFGKVLGQKSRLPRRKTAVAGRSGLVRGLHLEPLEQRQLLSVSHPDRQQRFRIARLGARAVRAWVQQAVAPGTEPLNYNELDPRFGPPGYGKTAQGGAGPGENGEGIYNERNDLGYNQYFNYVNGQLPAPANGTNFFCLMPAPGGTYQLLALTSSQTPRWMPATMATLTIRR